MGELVVRREVAPIPWLRVTGVRYVCGCGLATSLTVLSEEEIGRREMAIHLELDHLAELHALGAGPCDRCGRITDHLRATSEQGTVWLCELHAPQPSPELVRSWLAAQNEELAHGE